MLTFSAKTDTGLRRRLNEDSVFASDRLFAVCDGVGGHKAGEVASRLAIDTIAEFIRLSDESRDIIWPYGYSEEWSLDGNRIMTAIKLANREIHRTASRTSECAGMGTTVVATLFSRNAPEVTFASVGDSRIYLIRDGRITQITHDDSWANLAASDGRKLVADSSAMRHVLTKALGAREQLDFDIKTHDLRDEDVLLLCSDGLTNMLDDSRIRGIVCNNHEGLDRASEALVAAANEAGGRDNISAVLVRYTA